MGTCLCFCFLSHKSIAPSSNSPLSSLEILFKRKPDYSFLKVLGCACYPPLRPFNKNKLQYRSFECVFLGYCPLHKGYWCLDSNGKIIVSRDVKFNESLFPFQVSLQQKLSNFDANQIYPSAIPPVLLPSTTSGLQHRVPTTQN